MKNMVVQGVGKHLPSRIVTNQELESRLDTSDEWITKRTGIKQRHFADKKETTSDLGLRAAELALENAAVDKDDIDMILFATISPDHEFPGTGCFLQAKLGLKHIPALDIRQQCSGFLFGLSVAQQYIATGAAKRILFVASEIHSKCLDFTPRGRDVAVLFGDGAAACVLGAEEPSDKPSLARVRDIQVGCDGSQAKTLWCPAPGNGFDADLRLEPWMMEEALQFPQMNGRQVFTNAVQTMSKLLVNTSQRNNCKVQDLDAILVHQANIRIVDAIADHLEVSRDKFFVTIHKYGNTTAASIPLGMVDAYQDGVLHPGMKVGLAAFGSGFTFGAAFLDWL